MGLLKKNRKDLTRPEIETLEAALKTVRHKRKYWQILRSTVFTLITASAIAVLVATLWMPVLQVTGASMTPTLTEGDIAVSWKGTRFQQGDLIAFYYDNKILIKRVIATAGQWVDIDEDGTVYLDGEVLDEPYLTDKAFGECNIELPYQIPESKIFVMGDHRSVSLDSRNTAIGCVSDEQIIGRLFLRVWPLERLSFLG